MAVQVLRSDLTVDDVGLQGSAPEADVMRNGRHPLRAIIAHPIFHGAIVVAIVAVGWTIRAMGGPPGRGIAQFQRTERTPRWPATWTLGAKVSGLCPTGRRGSTYQEVRAGELILQIDPADYQAQLELAQADLAAD